MILDDLQVPQLNPEDKAFLEEFTKLELLAMNKTGLKTLKNLPDAPELGRVSPSDPLDPGNANIG